MFLVILGIIIAFLGIGLCSRWIMFMSEGEWSESILCLLMGMACLGIGCVMFATNL